MKTYSLLNGIGAILIAMSLFASCTNDPDIIMSKGVFRVFVDLDGVAEK